MESAGIFATGSSLLELRAAVVIASNDPSRSRAAVARLGEQLTKSGAIVTPVSIPGTEASAAARIRGLPVVLVIAAGRDASGQSRFVMGLGEAAVTYALNPPSKLAGSPALAGASASLGEGIQPSLILDVPSSFAILEPLGLALKAPLSELLPILRGFSKVTGGGKSLSGGIQRYRLVLALHPTG
jgi:hypothetical protein